MIYNLRYPYQDAFEYWFGGFWLDILGVHHFLGFIFLLWVFIRSLKASSKAYEGLAVFYFFSAPYNNYAYQLFGFSPSDLIGSIVALTVGVRFLVMGRLQTVGGSLSGVIVTALLVHFFLVQVWGFSVGLISVADPTRLVPIAKGFVLALNAYVLAVGVSNRTICLRRCECVLFIAVFGALFCYLWQVQLFTIFGLLPYGSFSPAGWEPSFIPSFGSVSIERGHLGKLVVPLLSIAIFFHLRLKASRSIWCIIILGVINLSASSFAFLLFGLALFCLCFWRQLRFVRVFGLIGCGVAFLSFWPQIMGLLNKILYYGIRGQGDGGRGLALAWEVLRHWPLGFGYGGSTFRDAHGLGFQLNFGLNAGIGMLSVFFALVVGMALAVFYCRAKKYFSVSKFWEARFFFLASVYGFFVCFVDLIWFSPSVWAGAIFSHSVLASYLQGRKLE